MPDQEINADRAERCTVYPFTATAKTRAKFQPTTPASCPSVARKTPSNTMASSVLWDNRGISNPDLIPRNMDAFVRAQLKEQVAQPPNIVYFPVSYEETQANEYAPGPSSTGLMDAPFVGVVTFIRIAKPTRAPANGKKPQAGVVMKANKSIIGLTPGHTQTPCKPRAN